MVVEVLTFHDRVAAWVLMSHSTGVFRPIFYKQVEEGVGPTRGRTSASVPSTTDLREGSRLTRTVLSLVGRGRVGGLLGAPETDLGVIWRVTPGRE